MNLFSNAFLIGLALTFSISAYAQGSDAVATSDSSNPEASEPSNTGPLNTTTENMRECGRGYVVGLWPGNDGWNDWGVWLSEEGPSWSNGNIAFYRAFNQGLTNEDAGWALYTAVMQAMATGQMVALLDDNPGEQCRYIGRGYAMGKEFDSVQTWYP